MSTFKRLFNVGKGKVKTAQRDLGDAVSGNADKPAEWVDKARHTAADAAEAVADALRPEDGEPAPAPRTERPVKAHRPGPEASEPDEEPAVEDAEEVASKIEQADKGPRKRTL